MSASEKTPPAIVHTDDHAERKWPHLIVLHGAGVGEVHRVVGREAVVGRDLGCDVRIEHPTVSRRHARLIVAGERVFIEDLGSTNGTLVGLNTVRGRRIVPDGAVVALGSVTLLKLTYSAILDDVLRRADYQRATTDPATRVASLEYLRDQLRAECAYARRHREPLTIVSFRADELDAGADRSETDAVMGALAVTIHDATRDEDVLARSERAEFIVLLRADADQARVMAERVRSRVADARRVGGLGSSICTVTCAVVQLGKTALASPENVIDWATTKVRAATTDVRDRVVRLAPLESPAMTRKDPE
jgi:diguanylate cyclase (GGDEF)-like protein